MLPGSIRPAFGLAYLLCRYADTIADTALLPAERRIYWIEKFPQIVRGQNATAGASLSNELTGTSDNPYEAVLITHLAACLDALNLINPAQKNFIYDVVDAVCEGMKIDLQTFPNQKNAAPAAFKTPQDLMHYCRLMGGKPGLFWSQLIAQSTRITLPETRFFELGQQIGDGLQIVNILRDLSKDLQNGRCYFAQTDLPQNQLSPRDLLNKQNYQKFIPVQKKWIAWGKQNLQSAFEYYRAIPKKSWRIRAAVAWPVLWTADTFAKLNGSPDLLNPHKRIKISRLRIYATILLTPFFVISNRVFSKWLNHKLSALP